ncbi:non-structural maintenance of chromosomes element 1 homolog isoform X2 [Tripterygium wilfordii]|uniref:non-structural maintenance of chromosomes element 1 homolog isoform X2 n=1 Tax=Tripterygium wilfordii TaxID=458696 RepID=UPI0018F83B85|nr:non-structural maintenance of chromosomes element 1 homolog isoform X2 [Tripterygium wilfordii]
MSVVNWKHHALIQPLLARGPQKEQEINKIFAGVTGKNPGNHQQHFNDYLSKINKELSYVQFELRCCRNQNDGQVCYGVVNNVSDEQSKLGTKYSTPQIALYRGILPTENGSQSQDGVPPALRNFSMSQKEKTVNELVHDQWLSYCTDGNVGLGVRSFLDLRSWFRNNDVPFCAVCNEAAVKAELCQGEDCSVRIHNYCLKKKFSQRRSERACPTCGTPWKYQMPKAEAVEFDGEPNDSSQSQPHAEPMQSQQALGSKRKKPPRTSRTNDAEITGQGSHQDSPSSVDFKRVTRASARSRVHVHTCKILLNYYTIRVYCLKTEPTVYLGS